MPISEVIFRTTTGSYPVTFLEGPYNQGFRAEAGAKLLFPVYQNGTESDNFEVTVYSDSGRASIRFYDFDTNMGKVVFSFNGEQKLRQISLGTPSPEKVSYFVCYIFFNTTYNSYGMDISSYGRLNILDIIRTPDPWHMGTIVYTQERTLVIPGSNLDPVTSNTIAEFLLPPSGYTITFETNGGSEVPALLNQTNLPDPLPTTTREGYAFTGWYTDSSLIFPAIPGATITEDTTLYAGWRPNEFTITFNTNGGEPIGQLTKQNHLPDPLPIPVKQGNTFAGWFTDSTLLTPAVPGAAISHNTTLYAKWEEIQSTDIHVPAVNTPSLLQTGFVTMWKPTLEEVRSLADFLWTTNIFDNLRKLFNDPMEAVLFLGIVPCDMTTGERGNIFFGNLDSDVESSPVTQQYYTFDFGDISLVEYYNSFLDYEPNTFAEIFLPFCGTHRLSINEIMGATINVKYNVDIFTGTCVAMLTITKPGVDSVMYSFEGNIMATIPVTAKSYSDFLRSAVTAAASGIAMGMML